MSRFKGRPASGLPGSLPAGETLLWQGAPDWRSLARGAFRIRILAVYFGFLFLWRVSASVIAGHSFQATAMTGLSSLTLAAVSLGVFALFAWLIARTTTYSITSRRVVITYGMALPKSINLPYARLDAVDLKQHEDGTGDLALKLPAKTRLSYLLLWPHVRSGAQGRAQPVLRCIANAAETANILTTAIERSEGQSLRAATQPELAEAPLLRAQAA